MKNVIINNVDLFAISLNQGQFLAYLPYVSPVTTMSTNFLIGVIVDSLAVYMTRAWHLITSALLVILSSISALYFLAQLAVFVLCILGWTLSGEVSVSVEPATSSLHFGDQHFALISGIVNGIEAISMHTSTVYWCIASKLKAPRNFYWMSNMFLWVEIFIFFVCYNVVPKRHSQLHYELNGL